MRTIGVFRDSRIKPSGRKRSGVGIPARRLRRPRGRCRTKRNLGARLMGDVIARVGNAGSGVHKNYIGIHHKASGEGAPAINRNCAARGVQCIRLGQDSGWNYSR